MARRRIESYRLCSDVLAVAKEGAVGDWAAYIGCKRGQTTAVQVAADGCKLSRKVAELIFPHWKKKYKWRY